MNKLTILASAVSALLSPLTVAQTLSGTITDNNGMPLSGAKVKIVGTNKVQSSDQAGYFNFLQVKQGDVELHITASQFTHENIHLNVPPQGLTDINVTMDNSSIEVFDVTASPLHSSVIESAQPVTVLAGDRLRLSQASTLGDTLDNEVGVHSSFYGSVASSPIIRGLDGPRVLITQNGLDAGDASRVGPDHAVSAEAGTATQIEVLRGPATLFYGSGAIGGVVNVVDSRVPKDTDNRGELTLEHDSVNNQRLAAGSLTTGTGNVAVYLDGFWRKSDDYRIPGEAELEQEHSEQAHHEHEVSGKVENSSSESTGFTLGGSYLLDNGFVGLSYGRLDREYGIPGHDHGHDEQESEVAEEAVYADMQQDRLQVLSELQFDDGGLSAINSKYAYTDYQHAEIEAGQTGTTFENQSHEFRVELLHREFFDWQGGLSLHYKQSDFAAVGEEAFTPPSETQMFAVALMEERHLGELLVQLGVRTERVTIKADKVLMPSSTIHDHDEEHEHSDSGDETIQAFSSDQTFDPYSVSAGLVWDFTSGYNVGISLSHSKRAPSAAEILSFGPHIGTGSYEVGALFDLYQDDDGEPVIGLSDNEIELEASTNLDLTFRKFTGDVGLVLNVFYNQVSNYYYEQATGLFAENAHEHEHEHGEEAEEAEEHSDELPVYLFTPEDVTLHGIEAQLNWQINDPFKLTLQGDYIRARLDDGGDLPRTPPVRISAELGYQVQNLDANIRATHYFKQDKIATYETETDGYTLLDANITYFMSVDNKELALYLKGSNLTDEEARVHSSFLKNIAPLPGRSLAVGVRGSF